MSGLISFWDNHIVPKIQPEFTAQDETLLKKLYWNANNVEVIKVESTETALMFHDYRNLKSSIKDAQEKADLMKVSIMEFMGEAGIVMRDDDIEFTWKKTKDGIKIDYKGAFMHLVDEVGMPNDAKAKIIDIFTKVKPGHRMFLDKCK